MNRWSTPGEAYAYETGYIEGRADAVKHGKWIYRGNRGRFPACECSVCGNVENADWAILGDNVNYCPNCGAKMEGDTE